MRYAILAASLASCVMGTTTPRGNTPSAAEMDAISCVIDLTQPSARPASLILALGILAGSDLVLDYCQPKSTSCAMLLEGLVVYDGVHTGDVVHETLHHYQWLQERNVDYDHTDPSLWAKTGQRLSVEWVCKHQHQGEQP